MNPTAFSAKRVNLTDLEQNDIMNISTMCIVSGKAP